MKAPVFVAACAVLATFVSISSPSIAQQKTVKQCQDEWRTNKAENQAKGIKEKDYVAQCHGENLERNAAGSSCSTGNSRTSTALGGFKKDSEGMSSRMAGVTRPITRRKV